MLGASFSACSEQMGEDADAYKQLAFPVTKAMLEFFWPIPAVQGLISDPQNQLLTEPAPRLHTPM